MTSADNQHETTSLDPTQGSTRPPAQGEDPQPAAPPAGGPTPGQAGDSPAAPADQAPGGDSGPTDGAAEGTDNGSGAMSDDLARTEQHLVELTTDLQRLQAEYVNYKRRVDRDRDLVRQNAQFSVLSSLLPLLDDIDRAREHGELEGGFRAVAESLERTVLGLGLEKFGKAGDEFDPNLHEALMHTQSPEATSTTCQNIVHAGYRIADRVVRPARVTVVGPVDE